MALKDIVGQSQAVESLLAAKAAGRMAHAYLFEGPDGVGKRTVARELAKLLLCPSAEPDACDRCRNCRRVEHGNHPNVSFLAPRGDGRLHKIDDLRDMQNEIGLKAMEPGPRLFVLEEADRMQEIQANCLLKTLEEPPPGVTIVLLTSRPDALLETVQSRCQRRHFRPLPFEPLKKLLTDRFGVEERQAELLARASEGSVGRALEWSQEEWLEDRDYVASLLDRLEPNGVIDLAAELVERCRGGATRLVQVRQRLARILGFFQMFFRDVLARREGLTGTVAHFADRAELVEATAQRLSRDQVTEVMQSILAATGDLERNAQLALVTENLLAGLTTALAGSLIKEA